MFFRDDFENGQQPCSTFRPARDGGWDDQHACPYCDRTRSFCETCHRDHHEGGWQTCKIQEVGREPTIEQLAAHRAKVQNDFADRVSEAMTPPGYIGAMDYRELLRKFINHVGDCEGVTFLRNVDRTDWFTDEEWAELQKLRDETPCGPTSKDK